MKNVLFGLSLLIDLLVIGQNNAIDVQKYLINITLSSSTDEIKVHEIVKLKVLDTSHHIWLDLYQLDEFGDGMIIDKQSIKQDGEFIECYQENNRVYFKQRSVTPNQFVELEFNYSGIPRTGLIISHNKFNDRTFFGDNWPDRAHHWIACNDHPIDKVKVEFIITAPESYDCVATGLPGEVERIDGYRTYHYTSDILLPTKVIVIGLADFYNTEVNGFPYPVSNYVYRKDSATISDLNCTADILKFFTSYIGPYPFDKLYNVQSTTQFGGMENAGNIFYDEGAFKGDGSMEALVAHEIAHQWFGNSASESDWQHLWLSEGFATYFTDIYWQNKFGTEAMNKRLISERERVIKFFRKYDHPVIDTSYAELMDLLNPNSYQKGAWILHMFRLKVGDEVFKKVINTYYDSYKYGNAESSDFIEIATTITGTDQSAFFDQWLKSAGHPIITCTIKSKKKCHTVHISQNQSNTVFNFPLEIEVTYTDGTTELMTIQVNNMSEELKFERNKKISGYRLDPNVKLLFELKD